MGAAVVLHEGIALTIEPLLAYLTMNSVSNRAPTFERPFESALFYGGHRTVEGHPGHHLGVREVLPFAPHLPDAVDRLLPDFLQAPNQLTLQIPAGFFRSEPSLARQKQRIDDLAVDVELQLLGSGV